MKRKRFYNNKKRNQKWTEEEKGRKIDFADKYVEGGNSSDKFDSKRPKSKKNSALKKAKRQRLLKNLLIAVICLAIVSVGYTGMDVFMTRREGSFNPKETAESEISDMQDISISFSSYKAESVSLDSSVMLSSVISDITSDGFTSITFDAKRNDGTIGYASSLASVDTFNAISSPASQPASSVKELLANDILPVARISCYKDNIVPAFINEAAITNNGKLYKDDNSNTYLNPNSEIAYNYLKDIIQELADMGVSVFVLADCDLPTDISKKYNDGFEYLSNKLYEDLDKSVKLLEEIDVSITGKDSETGKTSNSAIKKDIKAFKKINKNQTYFIFSKLDNKRLTDQLEKNNITSYIIDN